MGENILVAPVMKENARVRDIYFPSGLWRDENDPNKAIISGRTWVNYPANLSVLPWFTKVSSSTEDTSGSISHVSGTSHIMMALGLISYLFW